MKNLPPGAFGNCVLRHRRLPWSLALPAVRNHRRGPLISWPNRATHSGNGQQPDRQQPDFHVALREPSELSLYDQQPFLHECASPALDLATCTCCPSSSESDGLITTRSLTSTPPRTSSVVPKSRPMLIRWRCTFPSLSTTATCAPSARKSMALTGIVILGTAVPVAKCTWPKDPGSNLPSLLGTSTSVFSVRVPGSMASAVRTIVPINFCPGNSCSVTVALTPTFIDGA